MCFWDTTKAHCFDSRLIFIDNKIRFDPMSAVMNVLSKKRKFFGVLLDETNGKEKCKVKKLGSKW